MSSQIGGFESGWRGFRVEYTRKLRKERCSLPTASDQLTYPATMVWRLVRMLSPSPKSRSTPSRCVAPRRLVEKASRPSRQIANMCGKAILSGLEVRPTVCD
jgi:hypothetical protein